MLCKFLQWGYGSSTSSDKPGLAVWFLLSFCLEYKTLHWRKDPFCDDGSNFSVFEEDREREREELSPCKIWSCPCRLSCAEKSFWGRPKEDDCDGCICEAVGMNDEDEKVLLLSFHLLVRFFTHKAEGQDQVSEWETFLGGLCWKTCLGYFIGASECC